MWKHYNPNPTGARVGDCTVRAISKATGQTWQQTYLELCIYGLMYSDMPSANSVWGAYLRNKGFSRSVIPDSCPDCYTVEEFTKEHPVGTFILALSGHVVCVVDGDFYDSWDSGSMIPIYFWHKKEDL